MSSLELWQRMLPLALGAALSPLLLLGQLSQLTGHGPRGVALRHSLAYLLGTAVVVLAWSVAAGWIAHRLPAHQPGADPVAAVVQLLLALALLSLALQTLRRPVPPAPAPDAAVQPAGLWGAWCQGLALMAVNVTSLVLLSGRSGARLLERLGAWVARHRRAIDALVAAGFALLLGLRGLAAL